MGLLGTHFVSPVARDALNILAATTHEIERMKALTTRPGLTRTTPVFTAAGASGKLSSRRERQRSHEGTFASINAYHPFDLLRLVHGRRSTRDSRTRNINPSLPSKKYIDAAKDESDRHYPLHYSRCISASKPRPPNSAYLSCGKSFWHDTGVLAMIDDSSSVTEAYHGDGHVSDVWQEAYMMSASGAEKL